MISRRKILVRGLWAGLTAVTFSVIGLVLLPQTVLSYWIGLWAHRPPDATPALPVIAAPQGTFPAGSVGLRELARFGDAPYQPVGSGFLLELQNGIVIGVTTAHSVGEMNHPGQPLGSLALQIPGSLDYAAESGTLYAAPGAPRTGNDLTVDYILLLLAAPVQHDLVLLPDPRGAPQPGERVSLVSGLGDGSGGRRLIGGTVQSVASDAVWVLMDDMESPGGMSGSPVVSNATGRVVGMTIAAVDRGSRYLIGINPIGAIVSKASHPLLIRLRDFSWK